TAPRKAARCTTYTIRTAHLKRTRRFNQRSINDASQFQLSRERTFEMHLTRRCTHGGSLEFYKAAARQRGIYIWAMALTHTRQQLQWQEERSESESYR
ncbi:hypothetical protein ALC62_06226, partial [Cyphomyrmex costatus]